MPRVTVFCLERLHSGLPAGPICTKPKGHTDKLHSSERLSWKAQPHISAKDAEELTIALRGIELPEGSTICVNEDGSLVINQEILNYFVENVRTKKYLLRELLRETSPTS